MATISELVTRFGFEIDDKGLKELQSGIDAVKDGVLGLGAALAGEAIGLYELVSRSAEAALSLHHMSQETGVAVETLGRYRFMAKLSGVSTDELTQSVNILSRNLTMAKQGSEEVRKHFRLLGFSNEQLRSGTLKVDDVLTRLSHRFTKLKDGPEKTGLAMEIFGRGGARMVPFLNKLNQELDPVNKKILGLYQITEKEVKASEEFHMELSILQSAVMKIGQVVAFAFMPAVTDLLKQMKLWIVQNREMIKTNLTQFVLGLIAAMKLTIKIVDALVQSFSGLAHGIGGVKIATELLLGGFAVLSGISVLFGIGKVIEAVYSLATAFGVANLQAALIPIAIGAAMIAVLLIMEDIYSFFTGKDSFLGDLLKLLPELGATFKTTFEPIFGPIVDLITAITDGTLTWKRLFTDLGEIIINVLLAPLRNVLSTVGSVASLIGRLTGSKTIEGIGAGVQGFSENVTAGGIGNAVSSLVSPRTAVGSPGAGVGGTTKNNLAVTNQFNFPPGTDPASVGDKISDHVSDGLDELLRGTKNSSGPAERSY